MSFAYEIEYKGKTIRCRTVEDARRILEELRKRFGESFRPQLELDYIERLLNGGL